jgi:hypothetical protein
MTTQELIAVEFSLNPNTSVVIYGYQYESSRP